jgi:23S rRNA (pseudouridine1915-N3)-methyltransferase
LDVQGQQLNSQEFSLLFKNQMMIGQNIDIIVGGAFGLDDSITKSAHIRLSLSKMTLPHQLAKLVLLEQIYRSQTILAAHPYHK